MCLPPPWSGKGCPRLVGRWEREEHGEGQAVGPAISYILIPQAERSSGVNGSSCFHPSKESFDIPAV